MKVELQKNDLFKHVSRKIFESDILKRNPIKIDSRVAIFSKGQTVSSLYLLIEGSVNFIDFNFMNRRKDENKSRVIEAGEFFGYEEIASGKRRSSAAITLTKCEIYELSVDELNALIAQDSQILNNLKGIDSGTDPGQDLKTEQESEFYFDFRNKVDFAKEKQIKNKAEISEIEKLKESLNNERVLADKALSKEMAEISNKEKELKELADSLEREKELSEVSLSKEIAELEQKELKIKLLEDSISQKKEKAQSQILEKEEELKRKESELAARASKIEKEEIILDRSLKKLVDIEAKEEFLLKKSEELIKEKEKVSEIIEREEAIKQREIEIDEIYKQIREQKDAAQDSLQKKQELDQKQIEIESVLEELKKEKINVQIAKEKMDSIAEKEAQLEYRDAQIVEERKILEENLKKIEDIAAKQAELTKKQETINKIIASEERIKEREKELEKSFKKLQDQSETDKKNLGQELDKKEKEIKQIMEELTREKIDLRTAREKEQSLLEIEQKLLAQSDNLNKEKKFAEDLLKSEFDTIEKREKELSELEEKLKREKETYELEFQKEREELLRKIEQNESVKRENPDDKKLFEEELKKIKQREEELAKKEEALKREMELSEASLSKEVEDLLLVEKEIEEKLARAVNTEFGNEMAAAQLEEFRKREKELLERITELEKKNNLDEDETKEKEPVKTSDQKLETMPKNEIIAKSGDLDSDSKDETDSGEEVYLERNYNLAFQVEEYEDVVIVFVNIQRGVAASASRLKRTLDKLMAEGKLKIVVDLSFCDFLDSTFLGVLVTLLKNLNIEGGALRVVLNAVKISSSTFFLSGMDRVFNIQTNLSKAIREMVNSKH